MSRVTRAHDSVHTIAGHRMYETEKAVQFRIDAVSSVPLKVPRVEWFPFSQITKSFTDPASDCSDWLIVSGWILEQKNIRVSGGVDPDIVQSHNSPYTGGSINENNFDDDDIPF